MGVETREFFWWVLKESEGSSGFHENDSLE